MFKKISYMFMLGAVLLSWGFMISFAKQADEDVQAASVAQSQINIRDYAARSYVKELPEAPAIENRVKLRKSVPPKSTSTPTTKSTSTTTATTSTVK